MSGDNEATVMSGRLKPALRSWCVPFVASGLRREQPDRRQDDDLVTVHRHRWPAVDHRVVHLGRTRDGHVGDFRELEQAHTVREVTVRARRYAFSPARIEVNQGDIVRITLIAEDIPHSFTIDEYRISKRASPDRSVTFEFSADKPGRFVFYCSLTTDERCRDMRGELLVR
jgi:cytochrome c oxidase subunit II